MNDRLPYLRKKSMKLPLDPGVYIMKNKSGEIIYIGKAKILKNRVSQYFGSQNNHTTKVRKMVENVNDFDYILTDSEFEALVLECSLIKQHMPKYNILLKDSKGYSYVKITRGPWGRISACFKKENDGSVYLGPFTSGYSMRSMVEETNKIYKLATCNRKFPADIGKSRPCLNYYIGQCCAPCTGKVSQEEYQENLNDAVEFLKGGQSQQIKQLKEQMEKYSEALEFEKAAKLRDRINAMEKTTARQKVVSSVVRQQDVFAIVQSGEKACLHILRFNKGILFDSEDFIFDAPEDLPAARHELIMSYYSFGRTIPKRITLDGEAEDVDILSRWLSEKAGFKVMIGTVQKGEQASIMAMCRKNAAEKLAQYMGRAMKETAELDELKNLLGLKKVPEYIEAYDISHTAGSDNVAGMIVFRNGSPYKKAYKRFMIKGFSGQDDYGSMREVLTRRFEHYLDENETDEGFKTLPDLILLDGGQGQINAVKPVLEQFGLSIPLYGMVKDDKHRTRAIAADGGEVAITSKRQAFTLVSEIQEEVHRFAISYHKKKHSKSALETGLTKIEGIGEKKAGLLLKSFKTMKAISAASVEELCSVSGISRKNAEKIYEYFNGGSDE
ncbi:MAG: excinuclease ABC subunit UvrC [Oscillospiraceae bacterium]|nr:excinuclease ABC subunit UvrC [Oscillospiraceae bacterium]